MSSKKINNMKLNLEVMLESLKMYNNHLDNEIQSSNDDLEVSNLIEKKSACSDLLLNYEAQYVEIEKIYNDLKTEKFSAIMNRKNSKLLN